MLRTVTSTHNDEKKIIVVEVFRMEATSSALDMCVYQSARGKQLEVGKATVVSSKQNLQTCAKGVSILQYCMR